MDAGRGGGPAADPAGRAPARPGRPRRRRGAGLWCELRDGYWWVHGTVRAADGRRRVRQSLGLPLGTRRELAEEKVQALQAQLVAGAVRGQAVAKTLAHAALAYLAARAADRPEGWVDKEAPLVKRIASGMGRLSLAEVTTAAIRDFLARAFGHVGAETRRRACNTVGAILTVALDLGWIAAKPRIPRPRRGARGWRPPKVNKWLWPREIELQLKCCPAWFRPQAMFLFYQGRRPGESTALLCEELDLTPGGERFRLPETKTGEEQWAPLRAEVADALRRLRAARTGAGRPWEGRVFWNSRDRPWHDAGGRYGGLINGPWDKGRARAAAVVRRLARRRRRAGDASGAAELEARAAVLARCTPHWGRHSFASLGLMQGVAPGLIREGAGWRSASMIERYSHLADAHLRQALAGMVAPRVTLVARAPAAAPGARRKRPV